MASTAACLCLLQPAGLHSALPTGRYSLWSCKLLLYSRWICAAAAAVAACSLVACNLCSTTNNPHITAHFDCASSLLSCLLSTRRCIVAIHHGQQCSTHLMCKSLDGCYCVVCKQQQQLMITKTKVIRHNQANVAQQHEQRAHVDPHTLTNNLL